MRLASVYLTVSDMTRALAFYERLLQAPPTLRDARYSCFELPGGQGKIDLYAPAADGETRAVGNNTVPVFLVDNLDAEIIRLRGIGAQMLGEPMELETVRLAQFRDTEGNVLEAYEEKTS